MLRHQLRYATAFVALAGLTTLASGCSDPEQSTYVPTEIGKVMLDRPASWPVEFPVQAPWTKGYRPAPDSIPQLQVSGDFGEYLSASQGMGTLIGKAQVSLKNFEVVQSRDVTIKGATTGRTTQYTFTDNTGSQLSGEWIVAAHWPYPQSVAVSILNPTFDPDLERRLLDTMELRPVLK